MYANVYLDLSPQMSICRHLMFRRQVSKTIYNELKYCTVLNSIHSEPADLTKYLLKENVKRNNYFDVESKVTQNFKDQPICYFTLDRKSILF